MTNKFIFLTTFILAILLSNCDGNKKIINKVTQEKDFSICKKHFKKYKEKFITQENDSALIFINKAIECDQSNNSYKNSKVIFLITIEDYISAINQLDELIKITNDPTFKLQKNVIGLKIHDKESQESLNSSYKEFNEIKFPTSSNKFYMIALDNYFKGKDYALKEIEKVKLIYKDQPYESQNFKALEEMINTEKKDIVLFKLFNINN